MNELLHTERFIEILYFENERLRHQNGYYKTSLILKMKRKVIHSGIRYDIIGSELYFTR